MIVLFSDLEECYLAPLKKLFFTTDLNFKYLVISTLTSLLRNLVFVEWRRWERQRRRENDKLSVFPWDDEAAANFDPTHIIRQFIKYTEDLLCRATLEEKPHPLLQHAIASFYELVRHNNY